MNPSEGYELRLNPEWQKSTLEEDPQTSQIYQLGREAHNDNEMTVGMLVRFLDREAVKMAKAGKDELAKKLVNLSQGVEDAYRVTWKGYGA